MGEAGKRVELAGVGRGAWSALTCEDEGVPLCVWLLELVPLCVWLLVLVSVFAAVADCEAAAVPVFVGVGVAVAVVVAV